ncbi:Actin cytoskeleton organization protein [Mycena indigotica]|uniref:Actin cytoskeleton organization protein n=1 Tax=Mycena indigotica TaxID=2126181 RepID=A0A8H6VUY5_9AGAR|nr:Actin cytoskeleton organization protein [Mycena indigotica]KAF7294869.1 Actin cytoskeleton organization protein [Mycena indigotica]
MERQIRAVYDALDNGSNKTAIAACQKILKKQPKHELTKTLLALALVRSQKVEEALSHCDEVLAAKPTNDAVLTAMIHVLRGLGRQKDIVSMFEEASKQIPDSEELATQTFLANIRVQNFKAAQQIAGRMHKQFQEDRYIYWHVLSAILQASEPSTSSDMRVLLFKLAHRLITASPTPPYVNADRFHLHLVILRELGLFDEARTLLESEVGKSICAASLACNEVRRDIWRAHGLFEEEGQKAEARITQQNDRNWLEFLSVIDAALLQVESKPEPDEAEKADRSARLTKTRQLFTKLAEDDGLKDRSAALALVELEKRANFYDLSSDPHGLIDVMKHYFELFGDKACCFEDLKPYVSLLEGDDLPQWTAFLQSSIDVSIDNSNVLRKLINAQKLLRYNTPELTLPEESARATQYTQQYLESLIHGSGLPATELQPADDLAILAASSFISIWQLSNDEKHLYNAAALLEFALTKSKQAFQMRLLLVRIYRLLGAPSAALDHYRAMQIKQVQHDTLSHFLISRSSTFSLAASGDLTYHTECIESSQIYISNLQDTGEYIARAFTGEKYSQIPEFILFEDRLEYSLQRDLVKVEDLRIRLTHEPISSDLIDMELIELKFSLDRLHYDNRDFDILANYQPRISASTNDQTLLFGKPEGRGWLTTFLKIYTRAFQQASDLDDTVEEKLLIGDRPKQSSPDAKIPLKDRLHHHLEKDLVELTTDELSFLKYCSTLADWLEPYHDYARPPPAVVLAEAAKLTQAKTGQPLKGVDLPPKNGTAATNGSSKKDEEPPAVVAPPTDLAQFFDDMKARFEAVKAEPSPTMALHVASLTQEACLFFLVESLRFKNPSAVKTNKLGALTQQLKPIRTAALNALRDISASLIKLAETEGTAERRKIFVDGCSPIINSNIDHDFVLNVAKKVTDSRKKVLDGYGKGMARLITTSSK